jgi:TonB family protein
VTIRLHLVAGDLMASATNDASDPLIAAYLAPLERQVVARWQPLAALRGQVPGGRAALGDLRRTTMRVRLDRAGRLTSATVAGPSGLVALDEAAQAALAQAAPPPPEALDDYGELELRFEFHVDFSAATYLARVGDEVAALWRPPVAFQRLARPDAATTVRVVLTPAGVVTAATLAGSAGVGPLDSSALAALAPGTRLGSPPPGLRDGDGRAVLRFVFVPDVTGQGRVRAARDPAPP